MKRSLHMSYIFSGAVTFSIALVLHLAAQPAFAQAPPADASGDGTFYTLILIGIGALTVAFLLWKRSKKGVNQLNLNGDNRYKNYYREDEEEEDDTFDADKEMEWFRKTTKGDVRKKKKRPNLTFEMKKGAAKRPPTPPRPTRITATNSAGIDEDAMLDTKVFQEKMRKLQYAQLPINTFTELAPAKTFQPLETSYDDSLMDAIDQANDEYEEDENVRELAVRILAAFKTRNSVDALSQMALYDLSSSLRSKVVTVLADFDHESVFEPILLACADPTREVRAAAARGLFRLNFDRSHAWKRIIETDDEFRMRHAARAAAEAGMISKAFERLVHDDRKVAYEAFVLVGLIVKSGETQEIFEAIKTHKDERIRFALLHVLKVLKDERTLAGLNELQTSGSNLSLDVIERVRETIGNFSHVPA